MKLSLPTRLHSLSHAIWTLRGCPNPESFAKRNSRAANLHPRQVALHRALGEALLGEQQERAGALGRGLAAGDVEQPPGGVVAAF